MTDDMIPAGKVKEIRDEIKHIISGGLPLGAVEHFARETLLVTVDRLDALLPKSPTLADELRDMADNDAWANPTRLRVLADRVEALEQERDQAVKDAEDAWRSTAESEAAHAKLLYKKNRLGIELEEARALVEEQAAEIAGLQGFEVPGGWRVANHELFGPVIAVSDLDGGKHHCVFRSNVGPGFSQTWAEPRELSFMDEAPAPEETPEPREEWKPVQPVGGTAQQTDLEPEADQSS